MLSIVSSYMSLWSNILFNFVVLINIIVAFFYPFQDENPSKYFILYILDRTYRLKLVIYSSIVYVTHIYIELYISNSYMCVNLMIRY